MPDLRSALAQLFLAGRSPEEQNQRILQQRQAAGLSGSGGQFPSGPPGNAFPVAPQGAPPLDMSVAGPWGAGIDPGQTGAVPVPAPRPDVGPASPPHPADPMAAGAPTNATLVPPPIPTPRPAASPAFEPDRMPFSAPTGPPSFDDVLPKPKPKPKRPKRGGPKQYRLT